MEYRKKPITKILRSKNTVFTFNEISLIWGDTNKASVISAINYYIRSGQLYRIRKGLYAKDQDYDRFELATKIYTPSYISFETVLARAGVIFQFYKKIFVASYLTREITIDGQTYAFRKLKDSILTNPKGIESYNAYSIASSERAFLDVLYLNKNYHFDNLSVLKKDKIFKIVPIFKSKALERRVKEIYGI